LIAWTSLALESQRDAVRRLVPRFRVSNPRVFGSVARGEDCEESDLDLLVDPLPATTLLDRGGLLIELEDLLDVRVHLLRPGDLPPEILSRALADARAV
jgi:uncharacterized protein